MTEKDRDNYNRILAGLSDDEKKYLDGTTNFYQIDFKNIGGLVMPIILEFQFEDGSEEIQRIPAEIWKRDNYNVSKVFMFDKVVTNITLDPLFETADTDLNNNSWPEKIQPSRFQLYKSRYSGRRGTSSGAGSSIWITGVHYNYHYHDYNCCCCCCCGCYSPYYDDDDDYYYYYDDDDDHY